MQFDRPEGPRNTCTVTDDAGKAFEAWLGQLAASADGEAESEGRALATMRPDARLHLEQLFVTHGPVTVDELTALLDADLPGLDALRLQACGDLLPAVLADAASCGVTELGVAFAVNRDSPSGGLIMDVRHPSWNSVRYYGDNEPDGRGPAVGWDADTLVWLATGVQEACLLGPRPDPPSFWPLCAQHGAATHARLWSGAAVWWCTGGSGHSLAAVGTLSKASPSQNG